MGGSRKRRGGGRGGGRRLGRGGRSRSARGGDRRGGVASGDRRGGVAMAASQVDLDQAAPGAVASGHAAPEAPKPAPAAGAGPPQLAQDDTFSISALHLAIKVPYFSNSGHKSEKVTSYLAPCDVPAASALEWLPEDARDYALDLARTLAADVAANELPQAEAVDELHGLVVALSDGDAADVPASTILTACMALLSPPEPAREPEPEVEEGREDHSGAWQPGQFWQPSQNESQFEATDDLAQESVRARGDRGACSVFGGATASRDHDANYSGCSDGCADAKIWATENTIEVAAAREAQAEEIEVLASIYGDAFRTIGDEPAQNPELSGWELDISIDLPLQQVCLRYGGFFHHTTNSVGNYGAGSGPEVTLMALPPLTLSCELPPDYPNTSPPRFSLCCAWLDTSHMSRLARELDNLWQPGDPIGYTWAEHLMQNGWVLAGLSSEAGVIELGVEPLAGQVADAHDHRVVPLLRAAAASAAASVQAGAANQDAAVLAAVDSAVAQLLGYSQQALHAAFVREMHTCEICYDDKPGAQFAQLHCGHNFCATCMSSVCSVNIVEGTLDKVRCPAADCKVLLETNEISKLVEPKMMERWERLTLQKTLESMNDLVWCPRCEGPVIEEPADHFGNCPKCSYAFCTLCRGAFHPGTACMSPEDQIRVLAERAQGNKNAGEAERKRREKLMQEAISLAAVKKMSKPCPNCKMAIAKNGGCNKMTCGNCGCFFCWRCNKQVSGYDHFGTGSCVLFEQAEIDAWNRQAGLLAIGRADVGRARAEIAMGDMFGAGVGRPKIKTCPRCRQRNVKDGSNNHHRCWNCGCNYCFLCGVIVKKPREHFGPGGCKQHSN